MACSLLMASSCWGQTETHHTTANTTAKSTHAEASEAVSEARIRDLLQSFNVDIETRDFASLAKTATSDITVMWYGEKYSSWQEFNDQVLAPLADKPSPTNTWEIDKLVVSPEMAWAYTTTTRHLSDQTDAVVWMTFILERYSSAGKPSSTGTDWKITYIEAMMKRRPPQAQQKVGSQNQKPQSQAK